MVFWLPDTGSAVAEAQGSAALQRADAIHLRVDPTSRLMRAEPPRAARAKRFSSYWIVGLVSLFGTFALIGTVAATSFLLPGNQQSGKDSAIVDVPSLSTLEAAPPVNSAPPVQEVPVPSIAAAPAVSAPVAVRAPVEKAVSLKPSRLARAEPRGPARVSNASSCNDCPPISATDLPPLGPTSAQNGNDLGGLP